MTTKKPAGKSSSSDLLANVKHVKNTEPSAMWERPGRATTPEVITQEYLKSLSRIESIPRPGATRNRNRRGKGITKKNSCE